MKKSILAGLLAGVSLVCLSACSEYHGESGSQILPQAEAQTPGTSGDGGAAVPPDVAEMHQQMLVMDTHLDTPFYFHTPDYNFSTRGSFEADGTHVDLPRMKQGGLDGGFWVIFTPQGPLDEASYNTARNAAVLRQMSIRELAAKYSDEVELAFTADDAARIAGEGKRVVYQSMENAYPLGTDVSLLETLYIAGLRMVSPAHFRNNQFADSATDVSGAKFDGLSPLGEDLVREANRLGLILDGSHAADSTVYDMIELSTTPIILSHTGVDGVYDHFRNIPDALLMAIAEDGGVIQINAYSGYLEALEPTPERTEALEQLDAEFGDTAEMDEPTMAAYREARETIDAQFPEPRSTFEKFMEHLLYALDKVGPDHVGMGADWDGGGGVDGMSDVTFLPKVTAALLEAGYSEEDIEKIWSGNMLRLLRQAEEARTSTLTSPDVLN